MIYFISDLHFGHDKEFLYNSRGFSCIAEHDSEIVKNWNSIVNDEDEVYVLGDVIMNNLEYGMMYLRQLKGHIYIVRGNHDSDTKVAAYDTLKNVKVLGYAHVLMYQKKTFYLSHYPTLVSTDYTSTNLWKGLINLYGHLHSTELFYEDNYRMYNVAADAHNCTPVSIQEVLQDILDKREEFL